MKIAILVANYLLGLVLLVFGSLFFIAGFDGGSLPGVAGQWMQIMYDSKFMHVVKVTEILTGLMMVVGFRRPLAYVLAAPVVVNIALFYVCIKASFSAVALVLLALLVFLLFAHKDKYQSLLSA